MRHWPPDAFAKHIHRLARESEAIRFTAHARTRMAQRGIVVAMVLDCLRRGVIRRPPEQNIKTGWYECRMERYTGGKNVAVVAAVEEAAPSVIVVTVIDLDG
jgi:hypothetical protein